MEINSIDDLRNLLEGVKNVNITLTFNKELESNYSNVYKLIDWVLELNLKEKLSSKLEFNNCSNSEVILKLEDSKITSVKVDLTSRLRLAN